MGSETTAKEQSGARRVGILLALLAILLLGAAFRFYNVNWDKGTYHIHPDERHTTMVITRIQWPQSVQDYLACRSGQGADCTASIDWGESLVEYFDTSRSRLNPRNVDMVYFYGTVPLYLTKFLATLGDLYQLQYAQLQADPADSLVAYTPLTGYDQIHLVGRVLSGLFDLGSVLLLFFLARRLFDWRVGLIASFLLALTALNIQGSHYFAVDTFLTFFVLLVIWFTLDVAEGKGWPAYVGLGVAMGLTLACKVSVFLLAIVVALGAWLWVRRQVLKGRHASNALLRAAGGLGLAVVVSFAVFRVAQPYAWAGPNYAGWDSLPEPWQERTEILKKIPEPIRAIFLPNPRWIADIAEAGAQQTGEADLPWGRQWTDRTPWLYPLGNMVKWGLGVPLGVAAWLGVLFAVVQLVRAWRRRRQGGLGAWEIGEWGMGNGEFVLIPLAWVLLTFFWQGMQYVKSIRYFLPIYPCLVMFAAFLVVSAWDWARRRRRARLRPWATVFAGGLMAFVLLGTLVWALAFIQIYTEPVTRVQATRWIYENVESGATLYYRTMDGQTGRFQIPMPATYTYSANGQWGYTPFTLPHDLIATEVVMNDLTGLDGPSEGVFEVQITADEAGLSSLTQAEIEATFGGDGGQRHAIDLPDVELVGGTTYTFKSRVVQGAPLISAGAAIANEHFDDPLPFNMDGRIGFGSGPYRGLDLTLYDEDTPEKLEQLLDTLDEADYISMSSGRLWQSIPRLPMRYPVTTRYYELLFNEKLGFEKAAEFHSYPRLFGVEFDDTWAEEQFTVYDHPKVLIYRKTDDYDREKVHAMLTEGIDWDNIAHWLNPRDIGKWRREQSRQQQVEEQRKDLMLTEAQRLEQEQSGTWASIFNRNSLFNRWPTLSWLVLMAIVGLATLPLSLAVFHWLPDRGYILARPVGVLLLAWLSWILTNLTPLHYTRSTILLALALIGLIGYASLLLPGQRRRFVELWHTRKGLILATELLFLVFFVVFWLIRWGNPDLWHAWMGGEKPMDFAYLNAVIKSTEFPPYDPWFAGGFLNYYYFGQVMVGTLIKLIGIVPSVAYNLVIPTWFAMTAMGAFSVTYNLVAKDTAGKQESGEKEEASPRRFSPIVFGLIGALFVAVLGNLGEVHLLLLKAGEGVLGSFESTIPGLASLVRSIIGSAEVLFGGKALPVSLNEWYWNASRAIPAGPAESVITEFPFFTFLYADLHAHLIAMPLALVSLAIALAVVKRAEGTGEAKGAVWQSLLRTVAPLLLWALIIGAMRTTNSWDVPPHLIVVLGALAIAEFSRRGRFDWRLMWAVAWQFGLAAMLGLFVLYRPFWVSYGSFYNSVAVWTGTRTPLWAYFVVHGLFLFVVVSYLSARVLGERHQDPLLRRLVLSWRYRYKRARLRVAAGIAGVQGLPVNALVWGAIAILILLEIFFLVPGLTSFTRADPQAAVTGAHAYRGLSVLALGLPIAILGLLLLFRPRLSPTKRLWTYLVLLGLAMTLGVEVIVIQGDIGRMNTVFKFYLQVWLMWGVAAAAALAWMLPRLRKWSWGRGLWLATLAALVFFAALYPILATTAKVHDRFETDLGPGLDGWAYMKVARYWDPNDAQYELKWDLEAIRWLLDNVVGTPVILEGHTPEYRWGGRYSINTGLPAVLGWNWHQRQQRAAAGDQVVWTRANDVTMMYNEPFPALVEPLLEEYNVRYIVVGPLERAYYDPKGLAKFETMVADGTLQVVFRNDQVTIYEVMSEEW
jgi:YYY domain-containing protein